MQLFFNNLQDKKGNAISGASVVVTNYSSGTAATIYSADDPIPANEITSLLTDDKGKYQFYVQNGRYSITLVKGAVTLDTVANFSIFDGGASGSSVKVTFRNVAEMKAAQYLQSGWFGEFEGYYTPGDGGGNDVEFGTGFGTADNGSVFDLSGSGLQARGLFLSGEVSAKQFGAVFDGTTDDSNAWNSALAYASSVQLPIVDSGATAIEGIVAPDSGVTIASNSRLAISILSGSTQNVILTKNAGLLVLHKVVFDASAGSAGNNCVRTANDSRLIAKSCEFNGAVSSGGFGEGLLYTSTGKAVIQDCLASNNDSHGFSVQQANDIRFEKCTAHSNGNTGFFLNNFRLAQDWLILEAYLTDCSSFDNGDSGYQFGNFLNDNDNAGANYGHDFSVCREVLVENCDARNNTIYGFSIGCRNGAFNNLKSRNNDLGGLLLNGIYCDLSNIQINENGPFGVDVGGAEHCTITGGSIRGNTGIGLLIEAAQHISCTSLLIRDNNLPSGYQVRINAVGSSGGGRGFPLLASDIYMQNAVIVGGTLLGIEVADNPSNCIDENSYYGSSPDQFIRYRGDNNCIVPNGKTRQTFIGRDPTANVLVFPEYVSTIRTNSTDTIDELHPRSYATYQGTVAYITVTNGGSGYVAGTTTVSISGDGTGATAEAFVHEGVVVGVRMNNVGAGYTSATAIIMGDGVGALATAAIGVPLLNGQKVAVLSNMAQSITRIANPNISFPSATASLAAPAAGRIDMEERFGSWHVISSNYDI